MLATSSRIIDMRGMFFLNELPPTKFGKIEVLRI